MNLKKKILEILNSHQVPNSSVILRKSFERLASAIETAIKEDLIEKSEVVKILGNLSIWKIEDCSQEIDDLIKELEAKNGKV